MERTQTRQKQTTKQIELENLGQAVQMCREAIGMSQEQLAQKINSNTALIEHLESGQEDPGVFVLARCAQVFGISVQELIDLSHPENPSLVLVCIADEGTDTTDSEVQR